jgi:hypothetical protein
MDKLSTWTYQREVNLVSYTDKFRDIPAGSESYTSECSAPVIQTGQLYRQVSYTDRSVILTGSAIE